MSKGYMPNRKKIKSKYSHTTEKTINGTRHGVYHEETGDMKVMGLGKKGLQKSRDFRSKN